MSVERPDASEVAQPQRPAVLDLNGIGSRLRAVRRLRVERAQAAAGGGRPACRKSGAVLDAPFMAPNGVRCIPVDRLLRELIPGRDLTR